MPNATNTGGPWRHPNITDYYDVNTSAVQRNAARLGKLDGTGLQDAIQGIRAGVLAHLQTYDNELLSKVAVSFVDDLYKFGCTATAWDEPSSRYVNAVWGTLFPYLTERGIQVRYVVDNTWPDGLQRPLQFFPELYSLAGVTYICPHAIAVELPEAQGAEQSVGGLSGLALEARLVAAQLVTAAGERRMHFTYLEADFVEGALDVVRGLPMSPGTIEIFRTEPGLPGTSIELRMEPLG